MKSLPSGLLKAALKVYKSTISRLLGPRCRFYPSCSEYFVEAIQKRGLIIGTLKGLWRIMRCHPFSRGGYDPVR